MDSQNYTQVKNAIEELYLLTEKSQQQERDADRIQDLEERVKFVSSLFPEPGTTTMDIHLKAMIGMNICRVIEELSPNGNSNPNAKKLIIPVGIPGSGKSSLVKLYQDKHTLILDADDMRERIFNFVFNSFFKKDLPFNTSQSGYTKNKDIEKLYRNIINRIQNLVNFGIHKDQNIDQVKQLLSNQTNEFCIKGTDGHCPPRVFLAKDIKIQDDVQKLADHFLPNAFDICLLYCKEFNKNFIYDAPNCEPNFRNNLMIRANKIGDFKETVISVLLPNLSTIDEHIENRNLSGIRQTPPEVPEGKLKDFFRIADTQATELKILKETKEILSINPKDIFKYYKDKYDILSYDLYTLFNYLYKNLGTNNIYGAPRDDERNYDANAFVPFEDKIKLEFKIFTEKKDMEGNKILKDYVPPHTPPIIGKRPEAENVYGQKFRGETKFGVFDGGKKTKKRKTNKIKTKRKKGKRKIIRPLKTKRKRYTKRR